ncbi:pentatricopeptide repeat-containing protein 1, mitochondrial isoform X1 [Vanessa cardui]|uniref:pentatricopeptide repeat-containing protein 1, mitochondrial isoform X1 n=2 Tax=Vanessa cardui TaxID=171605 RepID=UPI001F12903C|nr:pentatricopeptide repeat-containing protein 1, mitochondrial isoform X1 [Vanessa cardui]
MALRCLNLLKNVRNSNLVLRQHLLCTSITASKLNDFKKNSTQDRISFVGDPDTFGTIGGPIIKETLEDEGDIKEEQFLQNIPLNSQKLSTKQYADLIKQYLKYKRIKDAIDVLEIKMLKEDRVKPENYIYNILIGACAEVGYTKKAFKLFNDMKRRALKPTGDTYTCLFESCINSPFPSYGLKMATHLRNLMIEKGVEPNITIFNVMIKTFGRLSDLPTAFKIVDEMIAKKIKIRVHTFNHLLQACIANKESGLKQALIVWRKMLKMKEKPNLYSFNLMLKCVKDCNLGTKDDVLDIIGIIQEHNLLLDVKPQQLQIEANPKTGASHSNIDLVETKLLDGKDKELNSRAEYNSTKDIIEMNDTQENNSSVGCLNQDGIHIELIQSQKKLLPQIPERTLPNLLSKLVNINEVLAFKDVHTAQDKFAMIGGQDDFLKEMEVYSVKPNIKTFTQMLYVIDDSIEAENKLMATMKLLKIKADIDFYNMLIKRRCLRLDYNNAIEVRGIMEKDSKSRQRHPFNKKHKLKANIMTYGVLAMTCDTKEKAENLLSEMKENQLKANIEILGTLLKNGTRQTQFGYILFIMNIVKQEDLRVNDVFIKHLEGFNDKCLRIIEKNKREQRESPIFMAAYKRFSNTYNNWLKEMNVEEVLKPEHPWKQFVEPNPTPIQRENMKIVEPKKFYKRSRKFIHYRPRL